MTDERQGPAGPRQGPTETEIASESQVDRGANIAPTSERLAELQRITDAALAYLPLEELLEELLRRVTEILDSDTAAILLLDHRTNELVARAARGIEEEVQRGVRIPLGAGFAGRIAARRGPMVIDDVDHADILNPILREKGIRSLVGVPLIVEGRALGVLHAGSLTDRTFTEEDVVLLQLAADRAALAIEHSQLTHERQVAQTLQRSLLPSQLPAIPGLALAARYMPAAEVGGDWYDAFLVPGGKLVLVIGDVMGRGVPAAALMAQLRTALRAYILPGGIGGTSLSDVGEGLNRLLLHLAEQQMATLVCTLLDPETGDISLMSAGHPPPLVIAADGQADYLALDGSAPLGLAGEVTYSDESFVLPVGSTLLLYTDGLVEVRDEPIDEGLERLRGMVAQRSLELERLCDHIVRTLAGEKRPDDIALLGARMLPLGPELATRWEADVAALGRIRSMLRRWLREQGADEEEVYELTVAVQEACANAVQHAYGPGAAEFALDARRAGDEVSIAVRDHGSWRSSRGRNRGRGMVLMRSLADEVEIAPGADGTGTTVEMRRRLSGASAR